MPRRLALALLAVALPTAFAAPAHAGPLSFSAPLVMPGSPPDGTAQGGEPGISFDPSGNGWAYVVAPGARGGPGGVNFWRTSDGGRTFRNLQIVGSQAGGSDSDVLVVPNGTVYVADLEVAATAICRSKDHGATFDNGCDSGQASDQSGPVSDREWLNVDPRDSKTLFNTYDGLGQAFTPQVMVSHSAGDAGTWQPCGQVLDPTSDAGQHYSPSGATENSEVIGRPAIGRDGTMFVPFTLPNNQAQLIAQPDAITESGLYVAVGPKGGCTTSSVFKDVAIANAPGSDFVSLFPNIAVDAGGTVYVLDAGRLSDKDTQQGVYLWRSTDGGQHFDAKPTLVSSPDLGADQLTSLAVGEDPGELIAGWYGASNVKTASDSNAEWRYYVAESFDGGRTWSQSTVTPQPFHHGNICNKGILCSGDDNRNLLDFTTVAVDPATGCGAAVFGGDPYNARGAASPKDAAAYFVRQVDGPCLIPGVATAAGQSVPSAAALPTAAAAGGCRDRVAPVSRIRHATVRRVRGRVVLQGRSSDRGCGRLGAGRVHKVRVSIARASGTRCRYLLANGRFSGRESCRATRYLTARGTTSWRLTLRHLPRGHYKLWVRGVDAAGNIERKVRGRNFRRLTVR